MIRSISEAILNNLYQNGKLNAKNREIYEYALDNFISGVITWCVFCAAAVILGLWDKMLIFVIFYAPIRKFAGGYHAKTRVGCLLLSLLSTLLLIYLSLLISSLSLWYVFVLAALVLTNGLVFSLAPVDHPNRRLSEEKKYLNKHKSRCIIMSESVLVIIGILLLHQGKEYVVIASMALLLEGAVLVPYKLKKEDIRHD